jgi:hypothetical protein
VAIVFANIARIYNPIPRGEYKMPATAAFHSINEVKKPAANRVHHNNSACPPGRDIPHNERMTGTGGYRLCDDCAKLNGQGR